MVDAAPVSAPARSVRTLALATAAVFALNGSIIAAWVARLPATRDRLDVDPGTLGLLLLMSGLGSLIAMPFVGRVAARTGSRPVVLGTAAVAGIAVASLAVTPDVVTTGVVLLVFGAAYGSWDVAMNIQGSFVDRTAGRDYMPRYHACWSVGGIVGAGLGALAAAAGVPLVVHFGVAALVGAGGAMVVAARWYVDDRAPATADEQHDEALVARPRLLSRRLVLIGLITLCACLMEGAAADWVAIYLADDRAATQSVAAIGYATFAFAMAGSRFAGTPVIARIGRAPAIRTAGVVALVGVSATLLMPGIVGALVGVLLWGVGVALVFPAAMSAGGEVPGRAADGIAAVSTIGYGGFLVGPPLIGLVARHVGIGTALWILPVLGLAIAVLAPAVGPVAPRKD